MKVKQNFKEFEDLDKELKYLENHIVVIGVLSDDEVNGVSVKDYSIYVEYGTIYIPARPFFRTATTATKAKKDIENRLNYEIENVIIGKKSDLWTM
jgi:hypothetical protein